MADGLAEGTYLPWGRRIGFQEAFRGVDGAEGGGTGLDEDAVLDAHELKRAAADIDEVAITDGGAVHDAEEAGERLFAAGENADTDARLGCDLVDEVDGVRGAAEGFGPGGYQDRGGVGASDLGDDAECAEAALDAFGGEHAVFLAHGQAGIEAFFVNDFEGERGEFAGDEEADGVRTDIDNGDDTPMTHLIHAQGAMLTDRSSAVLHSGNTMGYAGLSGTCTIGSELSEVMTMRRFAVISALLLPLPFAALPLFAVLSGGGPSDAGSQFVLDDTAAPVELTSTSTGRSEGPAPLTKAFDSSPCPDDPAQIT